MFYATLFLSFFFCVSLAKTGSCPSVGSHIRIRWINGTSHRKTWNARVFVCVVRLHILVVVYKCCVVCFVLFVCLFYENIYSAGWAFINITKDSHFWRNTRLSHRIKRINQPTHISECSSQAFTWKQMKYFYNKVEKTRKKHATTHLTLLAAIPLVAASGAHELRFTLFAALALLRRTVVQTADNCRRSATKVLLMVIVVHVLGTGADAALVDDKPIGTVVRFVVLFRKGKKR